MHMFSFDVVDEDTEVGAEDADEPDVITSMCIFNSFIFFKPFY